MTPEEVAALAVVVNGTTVTITPKLSSQDFFRIMLPIEPFVQIMGDRLQWLNIYETLGYRVSEREYAYLVTAFSDEIVLMINHYEYIDGKLYIPLVQYFWWLGFNFIVYDGQILIIQT